MLVAVNAIIFFSIFLQVDAVGRAEKQSGAQQQEVEHQQRRHDQDEGHSQRERDPVRND